MNSERWQQIDELFQAAVELEPGRRAAFLDEACAGDQALRDKVESLLASDADEWNFIEEPALQLAAPFVADDHPQLVPGQHIAHYEIVSLIGRGGMGEVYLAKDETLNRRVALKLLPVDYTRDKDRLRRFQQEAHAASALNHPNILTIHELGLADGQQFIATEFVDGETLRERMKHGALSLREALDIAVQTASALAAAHQAGIVHRDIKPENIMLRPDGYVKVLDFGLAKLTEQHERTLRADIADKLDTSSGLVMGTVKYMSPEQARGLSVDPRSDIFSLGVVLYEMLAGHAPFKGEDASDLIKSILKDQPLQLQEYLSDAPEDLQRIVSKALTKDKAKRYQTAEALVVDLKALGQQIALGTSFRGTAALDLGNTRTTRHATDRTEGGEAVFTKPLVVGTTSSIQYVVSQITQHKTRAALGLIAFVILVGSVTYPLKKLISKRAGPFERIKMMMLSANGNVAEATISPDGKYVAYTTGDNGLDTLWIKQLATNSDVQIIPPIGGGLGNLVFTPDSKYLYWHEIVNSSAPVALYRMAVAGGAVEKLVDNPLFPASAFTFSPDGRQFAFIRSDTGQGLTALVIANVDGTGERTVATRKAPNLFPVAGPSWSPSWSPDGKVIAYVSVDAGEGGRIFEVNIETGVEKPLTSQKWNYIANVAWLPDSSGILFIASNSSISSEIYRVSYPGGELQRITNDVNRYDFLSLSSNSGTLLTLQITENIDLWIAPDADATRARAVISGRRDGRYGLTWTPDGRIVYVSEASSSRDIWIVDASGTNQKQLTIDSHENGSPSVTPDGRYIVFQSNRTGAAHIWRMDVDGGNQKQLTFGAIEGSPNCSPDSKWVVYNAPKSTVWKASIEGGDPVQITDIACLTPAVSPDGRLIACVPPRNNTAPTKNERLIFPFDGGKPVITLDLPVPFSGSGLPVWTTDSRSLTYVDFRDGVANFWNKPIDGSPSQQLTNFRSDQTAASHGTLRYAWSPNGRDLAYTRYERKSDMLLIRDLR
jgi:serine/threonine protein kinase/Tol biopolymer transport system component